MIMRSLSTYAASCYCVFLKKLLLQDSFVVIKYAVLLGFQWLLQVHGYRYLQDYGRLVSRKSQTKNEHM